MATQKIALSVDLDGTIINSTRRFEAAKKKAPEGSNHFWSLFLDGSKYFLDEPIEEARVFLQSFVESNPDVHLVYLSSRPEKTLGSSRRWLKDHNYPDGEILHRRSGKTIDFKRNELLRLQREGYIVFAHIGDSDDDYEAAKQAGVKAILIEPNSWNNEAITSALWDE